MYFICKAVDMAPQPIRCLWSGDNKDLKKKKKKITLFLSRGYQRRTVRAHLNLGRRFWAVNKCPLWDLLALIPWALDRLANVSSKA